MQSCRLLRLLPLLLLSLLLHPTAHAADPPALPLSVSEYSVVTIGTPSSSVRVDFFLDLVCADTKNAWPVIKEVIETYGRDVQWRFHQFPLPYHTNAFLVAKGAVVAATYANDTAALGYMDLAFDRQSDVLNEQTIDMTYTEVSELVQGWVHEATGLSDTKVKKGLKEVEVEEAVRFSFKYAAIRSVYGTPMFMVNQMMVPGLDSESKVEDWKKYLEPLLARAERED